MLSQYLYISTAPDLRREEVDAILTVSERNNPALGVTGLLLYNGRNFLQLLEGEEATLRSLMVRINSDLRHSGVSMIERAQVETRNCADWAMKRIEIAYSGPRRQELLTDQLPEGLNEQIKKIVMNFAMLN